MLNVLDMENAAQNGGFSLYEMSVVHRFAGTIELPSYFTCSSQNTTKCEFTQS
jgi:hypothetical protein